MAFLNEAHLIDVDSGVFPVGGVKSELELNDVLREFVLLALPMQRLCSENCKGICPECGQNAWAKPGARLICGECFKEGKGDICYMLAEQLI